ncbi:MAG: VOC family protein [Phycisphaerales bacterium]
MPENHPKLTGAAPVFLCADFDASVAYYRDALRFDRVDLHGEPPDFAILSRDSVTVMLARAPKGHKITPNWTVKDKMWNLYLWVDDAKAEYTRCLREGVGIDYTLHQKPYGCLEFGVQDPDGRDIAIGQIID